MSDVFDLFEESPDKSNIKDIPTMSSLDDRSPRLIAMLL